MVVLNPQKFLLVWGDQNEPGVARVYKYIHGGITADCEHSLTPPPTVHQPIQRIKSIAVLSPNEIVVVTGSAVTWTCDAIGHWTQGPTYTDQEGANPEIALAAKFGNTFLITTSAVINNQTKLCVWKRGGNNPRAKFKLLNVPEVYPQLEVANMFQLNYEEDVKKNTIKGQIVTLSTTDKIVRVFRVDWIGNIAEARIDEDAVGGLRPEIILATDASSIGLMGDGATRRLLIGSTNGTVSFWKVAPFQQVEIISAHRIAITCLSQTNDDKFLTGSSDRTVRLWTPPNLMKQVLSCLRWTLFILIVFFLSELAAVVLTIILLTHD